MTIEEYKQKFSGAPYELEKFAELALEIEDERFFRNSAKEYLESARYFRERMEDYEIQIG